MSDPTRALADGLIDWWAEVPAASYERIRSDPDVRFVEYPEFGFLGLSFNLHPEADGLFVDRRLRQALASCFDNEATVAAATGGHGLAIDSEIPRMSWAYPATALPAYPVDRDRAAELIESAGWSLGEDGIYEQGDRRLSTVVPLREGFPERTAWLRSVAEQVRSCGIELQPEEVSFDAILDMLAVYPHVNAATPDAGRPFDAYFGGLDVYLDPDPYRLYHSSECTSAERPNTYNFVCYQDPEVDQLIEAGQVETDLERRAAIYGEYAGRIAEDLPVIYAWSDLVREGIASTIGTTDPDGLALDTPTWYAPLERLTNVR